MTNKPSGNSPGDVPVVKKKIQPYPIPTSLGKEGSQRLSVNIVKLTQIGFICEVGKLVFKVADEYPCVFNLPATRDTVHVNVKVIKTYDQYVGKQKDGTVAARMVEFHFIGIAEYSSGVIKDFLVRIKQV